MIEHHWRDRQQIAQLLDAGLQAVRIMSIASALNMLDQRGSTPVVGTIPFFQLILPSPSSVCTSIGEFAMA
jgi:hypothetical protein